MRRMTLLAAIVGLWSGMFGATAHAASRASLIEKLGGQVPLDVNLVDEDGKPVVLKDLITKPTFLTLNYFRCAGICTPQLRAVAHVLGKLTIEPGRDFQVLTVSFDPSDTPDIAKRKRENFIQQIDRPYPPAAWRFLTGDAGQVKKLADAVGFWFEKQGNDYIHPAALIVLSPAGQITRYMYGISYLAADLEMAQKESIEGRAMPSIAKYLSVCFTYDPSGRRYVVNATRVAGLVTLLLAAGIVGFLLLKGKSGRGAGPTA